MKSSSLQSIEVVNKYRKLFNKFKKKYHRFWKFIYFNYHPHSYFSDGFVKHYNKLKQLEPNKWS